MTALYPGLTTPRLARLVVIAVLALTALRLVLAGHLELIEDEAYHWLWGREPALGYFDHPPMMAWWIAAGRALFGDTEFGIRVVGALSLLPMTWLVYQTHRILFDDERRALITVLWLHATLFAAVGGIIMSPDTPLVLFWMLAIFALAKVSATGDGRWWYLVGLAAGAALLSKYTGFFLGLGIVLWLAITPGLRHWFLRYQLYVGGAIAALVFAPNVIWNAMHGWPSFIKQFGRLGQSTFEPRFLGDFLGAQLGLLTPVIFTFGAIALGFAAWRAFARRDAAWTLIAAMTLPVLLVLFEYALHDRVQANWTAMIVPLAVIAGVEVAHEETDTGWRKALRLSSRRWAAPIGVFIGAFVYAQAVFDLVADRGTNDPTARLKGWSVLAQEVGLAAKEVGASYIATTNYGMTGLLTFYGRGAYPVVQLTARERYETLAPAADDSVYSETGIYVARVSKDRADIVGRGLASVQPAGWLTRRRPGGIVEQVRVYTIKEPRTVPPFIDWRA